MPRISWLDMSVDPVVGVVGGVVGSSEVKVGWFDLKWGRVGAVSVGPPDSSVSSSHPRWRADDSPRPPQPRY